MPDATYTIRFYFVELESVAEGERIINVEVQGKQVLKNFDIIKEAGGIEMDIVKTIKEVRVKDKLIIRFFPSKSAPNSKAILSGIEIISDDLDVSAIGKKQ
jgi:hypothetical protein